MSDHQYDALCAIASFPDMGKCQQFLEKYGVQMRWHCEPPYRIMARTAEVALYPKPPADLQGA